LSAGAATILLSLLLVANLVAQPQITRQPTNLVVAIGGEARFIVAATGTQPLRYQWRFDDRDLEGATLSLLRITNAQPDHSGSYAVVVTDTIGSTTSQSATLTVDLEWVTYKWANSGLPYNGVVDFEMDRDGAMWIATGRWYANDGRGLARFNGRNCTVWRSDNSPLPSNDCTGMTQDEAGNLWIATEAGLARFDRNNTWTVVWNSQVWYPTFDLEGNLWIGSGSGVLVYDGAQWTTYRRANSGLPNDFVSYVAIDGTGRKWISTYGGLAVFDDGNWITYTRANSGLHHNNVGPVVFDRDGTAWIATYGGGLARFDGAQWTAYTTSNSPIPHANLWDVLIDSKGVKWIATEGGLARFDGTDWKVYKRTNSRLPDDVVYTLALDPYENLWVGTRDGGAAVFREGGVLLRPQMIPPLPDGQGRLLLRWRGGQGKYQLQGREHWSTGEWQDLGAPTDQQSLTVDLDVSARFFRVRDALDDAF